MADSIDNKLDQLTQAVKGLYTKSSSNQGEIYNALTSLFSRYEHSADLSNEKLASVLVNEFRKTIDFKYGQMNQYVKNLEENLRNFIDSSNNPTTNAEITKILNDTANIYSKLNAQEFNFEKLFKQIKNNENNKDSSEIIKLSGNFAAFSNGFENIINTLNKNFADLFNQIKQTSSKEDMSEVSKNMDAFVSSANEITAQCRDLASIADIIRNSSADFEEIKNAIVNAFQSTNELKEGISSIKELKTNLQNTISNIDGLRENISNISNNTSEIKNNLTNTFLNTTDIKNNMSGFSVRIDEVKREIQEFSSNIADVKNGISDVLYNVNSVKENNGTSPISEKMGENIDNILFKIDDIKKQLSSSDKDSSDDSKFDNIKQNFISVSNEIKNVKDELGTIGLDISDIKNEVSSLPKQDLGFSEGSLGGKISSLENSIKSSFTDLSIDVIRIKDEIETTLKTIQKLKFPKSNSGNIQSLQSLQEPSIDTEEIIEQIEKVLKRSLLDISSKVDEGSLASLKDDIQKLSESVSSTRSYLSKLTDVVKGSDKVDYTVFSEKLKENNADINEAIKSNLQSFSEKLNNIIKTDKQEESDNFKIDLQKLSDRIFEGFEDEDNKTKRELAAIKYRLREFGLKQNDDAEKIAGKLTNLENGIENFITKLSDNNVQQTILKEFKTKLLDEISDIFRNSNEALAQFNAKIDKNSLQQIQNSKELIEEIQNVPFALSDKIVSSEAFKEISDTLESQKQEFAKYREDFDAQKTEIDQKFKDTIQKLGALILKGTPSKGVQQDVNSDELSDKIRQYIINTDVLSDKIKEYISNFDILKSEIAGEIQENINFGLVKIQEQVKKAVSDNQSTAYEYTLDDVESDLAKIRLAIEKNIATASSVENVNNKISELKSYVIDNSKAKKDIESELSHYSTWFKDINERMADVIQKMDDIQKNGFEDIKSRIVQSEKSKTSFSEHNARIEKALSAIINSSKTQNEKIIELKEKVESFVQSQAEAFNPSQFIDIFYDNMTQTKMLANRVEIIEDKMTSIQNSIEKLIGYVEQP